MVGALLHTGACKEKAKKEDWGILFIQLEQKERSAAHQEGFLVRNGKRKLPLEG